MARYILRRLVGALVALFLVASLVFAILRLTGDPVNMLIPLGSTPEQVALFRSSLGLDKPLYAQYLDFLAGIATLNLGISFRYGEPAMGLVLERIPATLQLTAVSLVIAFLVGIPAGVIAAYKHNTRVDALLSFLSFLGYATPQYWLGIMLVIVFAVHLGLLPTSGSGSLKHVILPAITLATWPLGQITRLTRSEMIEVLSKDYVRTARAKGLPELRVLFRHALQNASLPMIAMAGINLAVFIGGDVLVETVFAWPGMGRLAVQAVHFRDFPLVQSSVIVIAIGFLFVNAVVDVLSAAVDPRIGLQ